MLEAIIYLIAFVFIGIPIMTIVFYIIFAIVLFITAFLIDLIF